jgi:LysM repeat protein
VIKEEFKISFLRLFNQVISYFTLVNFFFLLQLFFEPQSDLYGQNTGHVENENPDLLQDTTILLRKEPTEVPIFLLIDEDTISLGPNDELITDQYTALGKPQVYDALHSFNYRRSDKFGGYINEKVNAGLDRVRNKGFKSDIKKLYIQINPLTLTVYWFAVVGPSRNKYSYTRIDSRGSAGGYIKAVEKQLPRMHELYPDLTPVKFLEFNNNVPSCYTWDGKRLDDCNSFVNIQQHFFKYRQKFIDKKLKSESVLDEIFGEDLSSDSLEVEVVQITDSSFVSSQPTAEPKVQEKKSIRKKKPSMRNHKVRSGDTLSEIAEKYRTSVSKIKKVNNLKSDNIRIGQILKIPN